MIWQPNQENEQPRATVHFSESQQAHHLDPQKHDQPPCHMAHIRTPLVGDKKPPRSNLGYQMKIHHYPHTSTLPISRPSKRKDPGHQGGNYIQNLQGFPHRIHQALVHNSLLLQCLKLLCHPRSWQTEFQRPNPRNHCPRKPTILLCNQRHDQSLRNNLSRK